MKTYARIESDQVVEIVVPMTDADDNEIPIEERFHPEIVATLVDITARPDVQVGWTYSNGAFAAPEPVDQNPVPQLVSMRQARLALFNAGILQEVNNAIANMAGPTGDEARIEWQFSSTVERTWPLVLALAPGLNLSDEQLDALFVAAAQL
jgi:hypothetical protein